MSNRDIVIGPCPGTRRSPHSAPEPPRFEDTTSVGDGVFNSDGQKRAFVWQGSVAVMFTMFVNGVERYDLAEDLAKAVVDKL